MIVRQFLHWVQTAPAGERAEATGALARAYLHSPLDPADRAAAEAAMIVLLDDPSPLVREALAHALGCSPFAPHGVIHALARDQGEIAAMVLTTSPVLSDVELMDAVREGDWRAQVAVACRFDVPVAMAAGIVEEAGPEACLALLQNPGARLDDATLLRLAERHGADPDVRTELLARPDLPAQARHAAMCALTGALAEFTTGRGWLSAERADRVTVEAREKATVAIAARIEAHELPLLVRQLRQSGQLTAALMLRALLTGNISLFAEALTQLSGMPAARVSGLVHSQHGSGFEALYQRSGMPAPALPAFRAALKVLSDREFVGLNGEDGILSRRVIERVIEAVDRSGRSDTAPLRLILRRFAAEAARDEARAIADDMIKDLMIAA